jgi:phospholipid-translocating ATPase
VVIGVYDANDRNPYLEAESVILIGFEMINIISSVREKIGFKELNMRIGIHTVVNK